jgi:hypothetical protein
VESTRQAILECHKLERDRSPYLCGIRENGASRHERWRIRTKLWYVSTDSPGLVHLDGDILSLDIRTMHRRLGRLCVLFSPELDHARVWAESSLSAHGSEGTIRTEDVEEL